MVMRFGRQLENQLPTRILSLTVTVESDIPLPFGYYLYYSRPAGPRARWDSAATEVEAAMALAASTRSSAPRAFWNMRPQYSEAAVPTRTPSVVWTARGPAMSRSRTLAIAAATIAFAVSLAGCGGSGPTSAASAPHASPSTKAGTSATANPHASASPSAPVAGQAQPSPSPSPAPNAASAPLPVKAYDDTSGTLKSSPKDQSAVLATMPGPKGQKCAVVGTGTDVRSGRIAMGNFAAARAAFASSKSVYQAAPSNFYVIPQARKLTKVTLKLTPLTGHGKAFKVSSKQVEEAAQWKYFPVSVQIPAAGLWRFNVTSGTEQGCFEVRFTS